MHVSMRKSVWVALIAAVILQLPTLSAAADAALPKTGAFPLTFSERSSVSTLETECKRLGWTFEAMKKKLGADPDYDLAKESFEAYVPEAYTGNESFGLLVWVSPGPGGKVPMDGWRAVLDKHKLIWVGANNAGNPRAVTCRVGLALDAADNMQRSYKIDPKRVYIAGASGGGRVSSMLGVGYPDVFTGGFYIIGCDFYRDMPSGVPGQFWAKNFRPGPRNLFTMAKKQSRHVLLTGEHDMNRSQTQINYDGFRADGFRNVSYFEVPGMGHQPPDAEWFEKGIVALDEPPAPPMAATKPATRPAEEPSEADRDFRTARMYADNHRYAQARARLQTLIERYPNDPTTENAKKLLQQISGK